MTLTCPICQKTLDFAACETAEVPCNVRAFKSQQFSVWRCTECRSIHADTRSQIDLSAYYSSYPLHGQKLDPILRLFYDNLLRRLRRAGLKRHHSILDHGCGGGNLVRFLHERGYTNAHGYDAYSKDYADRSVLSAHYDVVISQDVLEHVDDPLAQLRQLVQLCKPSGLLSIGTPNAEAVDLRRAGVFRHTLHQPYHRHILSKNALLRAGERLGLRLVRYYPKQYSNTLWPGLNQAFSLHYAAAHDDTLDLLFDGLSLNRALLSLRTLFLFFFGYFYSLETDIMAVFGVPGPNKASVSNSPDSRILEISASNTAQR